MAQAPEGSLKSTSRNRASMVAGSSRRPARTPEFEAKGQLLQKLCFIINGRVKEEKPYLLFKLAVETYNKMQHEKPVVLGEEYYRDQVQILLKKRGKKGDAIKFCDSLTTLKSRGGFSRLPELLHLLSELAYTGVAPGDGPALGPEAELMDKVCRLADTMEHAAENQRSTTSLGLPSPTQSVVSTATTGMSANPPAWIQGGEPIGGDMMVTEQLLVQDLIYSFQDIDGKILKFNPSTQEYQLNPKVAVAMHWQGAVLKMSELSWQHREVAAHVAACATRGQGGGAKGGVVAHSLASALRDELTEFYRLVASLQAQLVSEGLSLRALRVRTHEASQRMLWLCTVAQACAGLRGGALASRVFGFLQHGSQMVRTIARSLLAAACVPILRALARWVLDGELDDPGAEFFIAGTTEIRGDRLWHEKYRVQESMVPSFIPMEQANKILATGKSINFLREVCRDRADLQGRASLKAALASTPVEALFTWESGDGKLRAMIDTAYRETAARVIHVLVDRFQLQAHLQAMRDFLLLGQGDFIRYLMELMEPELVRPGSEVFPHNVATLLDAAVRSTNAQFAPADVLQRLDVRVLNASPGDTGWDVFTLNYHVTGPIGTVFASTMTSYLVLFQALWKAKRIEWVLSRMWKQQATASKMLRKIPELAPILQQVHLLTSEMIHFVHEMQYYVLFEVIECSWDELTGHIREAQSLDDIIRAHQDFLVKVKAGALLDPATLDLSIQLRAMFETVLQLQAQVDLLHSRAHQELDSRARRNQLIEERGRRGEFGISEVEEASFREATQSFLTRLLPSVRLQIRALATSYQNCVRKLLLMLSSTQLASLQLLSFRLDFNEHYKRSDPLLSASFTYQQRRLSEK